MRIFITILTFVFLSSCSRKVAINKTESHVKKDSSSTSIDTTATKITKATKETTNYGGDTLTTKIKIPFSALKIDSGLTKVFPIAVESNGIKISGLIAPDNNGNFDFDLKAIAKAVSTTKETTETQEQKKGVTGNTTTNTTEDTTAKNKYIDADNDFGIALGLFILTLSALGLACLVYWIYKQQQKDKNTIG